MKVAGGGGVDGVSRHCFITAKILLSYVFPSHCYCFSFEYSKAFVFVEQRHKDCPRAQVDKKQTKNFHRAGAGGGKPHNRSQGDISDLSTPDVDESGSMSMLRNLFGPNPVTGSVSGTTKLYKVHMLCYENLLGSMKSS